MKAHIQFLQDFSKKGNQNIEIIGIYNGCITPIEVQCKKCKHFFNTTPHSLLKGSGCPYCSKKRIIAEQNSFCAVHPELIKFLVNKKEGYKYSSGSKQIATVQCPICKNQYKSTYNSLSTSGFNCLFCNSMSYPNKFLRVILKMIDGIMNLQFEKTFTLQNNKIIRYDAVFEYQNKTFVIQINGGQHYYDCGFNQFDVNIQKEKDQIKKTFAENNHMIYIDINAKKSQFFLIKKNLLLSDFPKFIDISNLDWENIFKTFNNYSLLKQICLDYENNLMRVSTLASKYQLDRHQISTMLQNGKQLGLCPSYQSNKNRQGVRIEAYDNQHNLIGIYPSIAICAEKLNEKYNLNFLKNSISHVLTGAQKSHRNFYFKRGDNDE